ncbi:XRE family transcriptional regulator [Mesorhizobium sp. M2A.F.Ca.ET.043.02.1.1]|uniref:XRE family transcriptional regulator n=1 Tax=Mesorhizobium sp. M2A.F.Ca.ET.043.02.1.1 TaxID=2493670 RepID=UPI001FE1EB72|nr:XRE family transcriptional regulator [Mesorhizobium sp. M2A.F.Ca.ET.043.02.1.1]
MTHRVHERGYYAQTDSLQAQFYAQADFGSGERHGSVGAMTIEEKIRAIMKATGWKQQKLAEHFQVSQSTVNRWLAGSEPEGHRRDAINETFENLVDERPTASDASEIPLMGYLGAGAEVEPDFEQVPPEGLDQVSIPFPLPDEMIAFKVRGVSMLPVFKDGTIIVVYRDQKKPLESFYGEEAAVRTSDGRRFIKTIMRGSGGGVNLISWNAAPIEEVSVDWIGEIFAVLPPSVLRKVDRQGGLQGQLRLKSA